MGKKQGDRYEPDPAKWHGTPKTKQRAWYEFLHVTCGAGKYPYRVSVIVNKVIHHGYAVPHQVLGKDAPTNINFSLEYTQAFAEYMYPSTVYRGISIEGDRPEILLQVPDGGLDIQDAPVHWTLPSGRTECWSLREFMDAKPDQLAAQNSEEAYESIGREMAWDVLGTGDEAAIASFRSDPGTLADKKWLQLA